jgi:hypothetical protein
LHCIVLYCIELHFIAFHYITFHYIPFHSIPLHYITLHFMKWFASTNIYRIHIISWYEGNTRTFETFSSGSKSDEIDVIWYILLLIIIRFIISLSTDCFKYLNKSLINVEQNIEVNSTFNNQSIMNKSIICMKSRMKIRKRITNYPMIYWVWELKNWLIRVTCNNIWQLKRSTE